jgi:type II secretory pathway pseudopilin PulG
MVELIVVVTIILLLAALLLAALAKVQLKVEETRTRNDISQLAQAVQAFKTKYNVNYIPSLIILCESYNDYFDSTGTILSPLHADSLAFINKVWPRIDWKNTSGSAALTGAPAAAWAGSAPAGAGIDWNLDGVYTATTALSYTPGTPVGIMTYPGFVLEGEQTLVFFLGGGQPFGTVRTVGFSTNPQNPMTAAAAMAQGGDRVPAFFEFNPSRLSVPSGASSPFFAYQDGYGLNFYAYFSATKNGNDYNRYYGQYAAGPGGGNYYVRGKVSDCSLLAVWPYADTWPPSPAGSTTASWHYLNAQSCQIISAGRDGQFGLGSVLVDDSNASPAVFVNSWGVTTGAIWSPAAAADFYPASANPAFPPPNGLGADDMSSFYDHFLGVPYP